MVGLAIIFLQRCWCDGPQHTAAFRYFSAALAFAAVCERRDGARGRPRLLALAAAPCPCGSTLATCRRPAARVSPPCRRACRLPTATSACRVATAAPVAIVCVLTPDEQGLAVARTRRRRMPPTGGAPRRSPPLDLSAARSACRRVPEACAWVRRSAAQAATCCCRVCSPPAAPPEAKAPPGAHVAFVGVASPDASRLAVARTRRRRAPSIGVASGRPSLRAFPAAALPCGHFHAACTDGRLPSSRLMPRSWRVGPEKAAPPPGRVLTDAPVATMGFLLPDAPLPAVERYSRRRRGAETAATEARVRRRRRHCARLRHRA